MSVLVMIAVWTLCEAGWALVPPLRPQRWQLRLHLLIFSLLVACIYFASVWHLIPDRFQYGNGVLRYASDSVTYRDQAIEVAAALRTGSVGALFDSQKFAYSKVLGVLFAAVGPNYLAAMLVNGVFYSATLACLFLIGREMFGPWVGAVAMACASVWPGFILHEVQTIRWVGTTLGLELTVLGTILLIGRRGTPWAVLTGLAGYTLLMNDLAYMARIVALLVGGFGVALMVAALWHRALIRSAALTLVLGVLMVGGYYAVYGPSLERGLTKALAAVESEAPAVKPEPAPVAGTPAADAVPMRTAQPTSASPVKEVLRTFEGNMSLVVTARDGFHKANGEGQTGTALSATQLGSIGALLWNVPRALNVATFAPFPDTVLKGPPGVSNLRPFVLLELVPYLLIVAGAFIVVSAAAAGLTGPDVRRQLMFLVLLTSIAYALLGTIVVNAGTLYRFRQPYVLLQIVLAVEGWRRVAKRLRPTAS
jgi:hypothetical protein